MMSGKYQLINAKNTQTCIPHGFRGKLRGFVWCLKMFRSEWLKGSRANNIPIPSIRTPLVFVTTTTAAVLVVPKKKPLPSRLLLHLFVVFLQPNAPKQPLLLPGPYLYTYYRQLAVVLILCRHNNTGSCTFAINPFFTCCTHVPPLNRRTRGLSRKSV